MSPDTKLERRNQISTIAQLTKLEGISSKADWLLPDAKHHDQEQELSQRYTVSILRRAS